MTKTLTRAPSPRKDRSGRVRPAISNSQRAVYHMLKHFGAMDDRDLVKQYPILKAHLGRVYPDQSPSGLRTRRAELVRKGYIVDSGDRVRGDARLCIVWAAA